MTVQWSTTVRNAVNDAWQTAIGTSAKLEIYSGSMPANCAASTTGTKLVEWDLASTWAGASSGGVKTLSSLPISLAAVGGSPTNAGYYRIFDSSGATCHEQGTVTATGGGGDLTCDNISITSGQTVNLTGFSKTAPGA
jgi:hypothetical protein